MTDFLNHDEYRRVVEKLEGALSHDLQSPHYLAGFADGAGIPIWDAVEAAHRVLRRRDRLVAEIARIERIRIDTPRIRALIRKLPIRPVPKLTK